jgi:hypothetical protein
VNISSLLDIVYFKLDRVEFYVSRENSGSRKLPLITFIQGSGCHSIFRKGPEGKIYGGQQNLLRKAVERRAYKDYLRLSGLGKPVPLYEEFKLSLPAFLKLYDKVVGFG